MLLSLGVIISGLVVGAFLVQQPQNLTSSAKSSIPPLTACRCVGPSNCTGLTQTQCANPSSYGCAWDCSCSPSCSTVQFCSSGFCCSCLYGSGSGLYGPVSCCTPGTTNCQTYNVTGCKPAPIPTPAPTTKPTPTPISSCSPSCQIGQFCTSGSCCSCLYGSSSMMVGPISCCKPGTTICQTNNVKGCKPAPTPTTFCSCFGPSNCIGLTLTRCSKETGCAWSCPR
jgi:hypothetical protein